MIGSDPIGVLEAGNSHCGDRDPWLSVCGQPWTVIGAFLLVLALCQGACPAGAQERDSEETGEIAEDLLDQGPEDDEEQSEHLDAPDTDAVWAAEVDPSATVSFPDDPHREEYRVPGSSEQGTTAGQLRFFIAGGMNVLDGPSVSGTMVFEVMTVAIVGVRVSSALTVWRDEAAPPHRWALAVGPTIHFLPYQVVDLAMYVEGGVAFIDPFGGRAVPIVAPGLAFDVWLSDYVFMGLDGRLSWAFAAPSGSGPRDNIWVEISLGLGVGL